MRTWSRHSRRTVRTNRSANAFARGARIGVRRIRTPSVRNTSSNGPENLESRSRRRNRKLDEEEHVHRPKRDRLDSEEVAGQDARGLGPQELGPGGPDPPGDGIQAVAEQD